MLSNVSEFVGVSSEEEALTLVRTEPKIVASFPEPLLTESVLFEAISRDPLNYEVIDRVFFSEGLIKRLLLDNPEAVFRHLNQSLISEANLQALLHYNGMGVQYIPRNMLNKELCKIAVQQNAEAHDFIPLNLQDAVYTNMLIMSYPHLVSEIDISQRDPEVLKKVVLEHPFVIKFMSMPDRTPEVCEAIMQLDYNWIGHFPENVYDDPQMLEKISQLDYFKGPKSRFDSSIVRKTLVEFLFNKDINFYPYLPEYAIDFDMAKKAITHDPKYIFFTPTLLKKDGRLWEVALTKKPELYVSIPLDQQSDSIRIFIARETARIENERSKKNKV